MTEDEAMARARAIAGDAGYDRIARFVSMLEGENARQNLVSHSTLPSVWDRHILDSLQLAMFVRPSDTHWVDIGSGGGLPGIVLACLARWRVTMIEPRRGRVAFLEQCVDALDLQETTVIRATAQSADVSRADLVSARAVGPIGALLGMASRFSDLDTRFVLPRGAGANDDVATTRMAWHGVFHVEHSVTQAGAGIVVADKVRPK